MSFSPSWSYRLIRAGRSSWPSGVTRFHPWDAPRIVLNHELWFIWRGAGRISGPDASRPVAQGQLHLFHPGERYEVEQHPDQPLGVTFIQFAIINRHGKSTSPARHLLPDLIDGVDASLGESVTRRIVELLWETYIRQRAAGKEGDVKNTPRPLFTTEDELTRTSPFCPMPMALYAPANMQGSASMRAAASLLNALLLEISHHSGQPHHGIVSGVEKHHRALVCSIALKMQENPGEIGRVSSLASQAGYSADHFMRLFKKIMGCPPQQFLINARVNKAKLLLLQTSLSIKEISVQLGYSNAYFFSHQFKNCAGSSPGIYRRQAASVE